MPAYQRHDGKFHRGEYRIDVVMILAARQAGSLRRPQCRDRPPPGRASIFDFDAGASSTGAMLMVAAPLASSPRLISRAPPPTHFENRFNDCDIAAMRCLLRLGRGGGMPRSGFRRLHPQRMLVAPPASRYDYSGYADGARNARAGSHRRAFSRDMTPTELCWLRYRPRLDFSHASPASLASSSARRSLARSIRTRRHASSFRHCGDLADRPRWASLSHAQRRPRL